MSKINYLELSTPQILKQIFKVLKEELKVKFCIKITDFRTFVTDNESQFNCPEGWKAIENQWYNRTPNLRLVELMKEYKQHLIK